MTREPDDTAQAKTGSEKIRERAAASLLKQREFEWSPADQAMLDAWFAESVAHRIAYLRLEAAWDSADRLAVLREPMRERLSMAAPERARPFLTSAAIIVAVIALGLTATTYFSHPGGGTYTTPVGGHEVVTLAEGSQIELNTDTEIRTQREDDVRHVSLIRGEAYFQIKHDPTHPFVLTAGRQRIVDLGTKFLVRREASQVQVTLLEGAARLETTGTGSVARAATLTAGDFAIATADSLSVTRKPARELPDELGWRRGVLVFRRTTLGDAAAEFNRYGKNKIAIFDPAVASLIISGTFPVGGIELFSNAARDSFGLRVTQNGDETVISHR